MTVLPKNCRLNFQTSQWLLAYCCCCCCISLAAKTRRWTWISAYSSTIKVTENQPPSNFHSLSRNIKKWKSQQLKTLILRYGILYLYTFSVSVWILTIHTYALISIYYGYNGYSCLIPIIINIHMYLFVQRTWIFIV